MAEQKNTNNEKKADAFAKYFIKLGIKIDEKDAKNVEAQFKPLSDAVAKFKKESNFNDTIWSKGILNKLGLDLDSFGGKTYNATKAMAGFGKASKAGLDSGEFYSGLGSMGKGLVNITELLGLSAEGFESAGVAALAFETVATAGIALVVAAIVGFISAIGFAGVATLDTREELVKFDKAFNGSAKGLDLVQNAINKTTRATLQQGFAFGEVRDTIYSYTKAGLALTSTMNDQLIEATIKFGKVVGEDSNKLAAFYTGILKGSNLSIDSIKSMNSSFAQFNENAVGLGTLGVISFDQFKESVESASIALRIATARGTEFTNKMTSDLVILAGLANTLGLSISGINSKFEESSNLLTAQSSGFRNLLVIAGGANLSNLLTDSFNRTDSMLKVIEKLQEFNKQFGGNINITAQLAEKVFGVSKEEAVKLISTSREQISAIKKEQEDLKKLRDPELDRAYNQITNTLGQTWQKFKNTLWNIFQETVANNPAIRRFLDDISKYVQNLFSAVTDKRGPLNSVIDWIQKTVTKIANFLDDILKKIPGFLEKTGHFIDNLLNPNGTNPLDDFATRMGKSFSKGLISGLEEALGNNSILDSVFPGLSSIFSWLSPNKNQENASTNASLSKIVNELKNYGTSSIDIKEKAIDKKQNELSTLKDTDIIYDSTTNGFMSAGAKKADLENQKAKLEEEKIKILKDNNEALIKLTSELSDHKDVMEKLANMSPEEAIKYIRQYKQAGPTSPVTAGPGYLNQGGQTIALSGFK